MLLKSGTCSIFMARPPLRLADDLSRAAAKDEPSGRARSELARAYTA
jgi:hypothetical protein